MKRHSLNDWVMATRPWSFPASAIPVIATLAYLHWCGYEVNWVTGIWALVNIVFFHAAGNTWSDYHDYQHGVDSSDTYGAKTLTSGFFQPKEIYYLSIGILIIALAGGVGLMLMTDFGLIWFGLGGILCTLLYPYLKYRALGDAVIGLAYAWLPMWGTSYVTIDQVDMRVSLLAIPVGMITIAILHANNTRDAQTDDSAHIVTLAMKLGHSKATLLYQFWILFPFVYIAGCSMAGLFPWWTLLTMVALPLAWKNAHRIRHCSAQDISDIANLDEDTAKLQLVFGLLFSISFFIASL